MNNRTVIAILIVSWVFAIAIGAGGYALIHSCNCPDRPLTNKQRNEINNRIDTSGNDALRIGIDSIPSK